MASSILYQFKSQKEPSRVTFDGTGLTVYELKREIIALSQLGDGRDFDLLIYNTDTNEEYDEDTAIVPRTTSVIAKRGPPERPGQGKAARYVSGNMPISARNARTTKQGPTASTSQARATIEEAKTEEERAAAVLQAGSMAWEQSKDKLASGNRVHIQSKKPGQGQQGTRGPPPPSYVCFRCGEKGHYIQECPTNNDPSYEGRRVKRITGIPRAFLQTVDKPTANGGGEDGPPPPSNVAITSEGQWVVSVPDEASWEKYQEKQKASAAKEGVAASELKELEDRGLACPIDKRLFVDPVKTPCCGTTYCNECIENALINSDLVCPSCSTEGVLLDNLEHDQEMDVKIKAYEGEKKATKASGEKDSIRSKSPTPVAEDKNGIQSEVAEPPAAGTRTGTGTPRSPSQNPKKRPAEEELNNERASPSRSRTPAQVEQMPHPAAPSSSTQDFVQQMNALAKQQGKNGNGAKNVSSSMAGPPGMNPMMPMTNPMMMMMMPGFNPYMQDYGGNQQPNNGQGNWNSNQHRGGSNANFQRQGQNWGRGAATGGENGAYMRQPVNPHRYQNRRGKFRPTEAKELS